MSISLLAKAKKEDVKTFPYPYIVIENVLNDDLYKELEQSYPSDTEIGGANLENNTRYQLSAKCMERVC